MWSTSSLRKGTQIGDPSHPAVQRRRGLVLLNVKEKLAAGGQEKKEES